MTYMMQHQFAGKYEEVELVFVNTSQENEATLEFVHECEMAFGWNVVWLEAVVNFGERKSNSHRIVNYDTANRDGQVYEDHIKKYGVPNSKFQHCTRGLKLEPIKSYLRSIGWKNGTYDTCIGIRADEPSRRSKNAETTHIVYPLLDWEPLGKPDVNSFWDAQPFRLRLAGYQGNCRWCWKKSFRKLLTIIDDDPSIMDFPKRMEATYGLVGPEFLKPEGIKEGYHRTFFRGNLDVNDLFNMYADRKQEWMRAEDDAIVYSGYTIPLDVEEGNGECTESCEIDFDALSEEDDA